jgi:hypothetical protein
VGQDIGFPETQIELGLNPKMPKEILGSDWVYTQRYQRKFGYKLGIRPLSPLDFGITRFLWMLMVDVRTIGGKLVPGNRRS